jgi:GT2 family glycosyltransferase
MATAFQKIFIIIPVHNRKQITLNCLKSLSKNGDLGRYHVVVVDDGSTDGTAEAIQALYPDIVVLHGDGNLWWTGAIKKAWSMPTNRVQNSLSGSMTTRFLLGGAFPRS